MALSEEQKKNIEEEEAYRAKVRAEKSAPKEEPVQKKQGVGCFQALLIIAAAIGIVLYVVGRVIDPTGGKSTTTTETKEDLSGNARANNLQLEITNTEDKVWSKCWLTLNGDYYYPNGAPSKIIEDVGPGQAITIPFSEFTKKSGERFNIYQYKNKNVSASCNGRFGYWEW